MKLREVYRDDVEQVRKWRSECLETLRTPYFLTQEMQQKFYDEVICNRNSPHRFWSIEDNFALIGFGGITNIQWENRIGEISLIINPTYRCKGYGRDSVELLLEQGFNYMNLQTVFGECYVCNPAITFWSEGIARQYGADVALLSNRKFWNNEYHDSFYFSIDADEYRKVYSALH